MNHYSRAASMSDRKNVHPIKLKNNIFHNKTPESGHPQTCSSFPRSNPLITSPPRMIPDPRGAAFVSFPRVGRYDFSWKRALFTSGRGYSGDSGKSPRARLPYANKIGFVGPGSMHLEISHQRIYFPSGQPRLLNYISPEWFTAVRHHKRRLKTVVRCLRFFD